MRQMFFQLFHFLKCNVLGLSIFQQTPNIEHIVQVGLDLNQQLLALCVLRLLLRNKKSEFDISSGGVSVKTLLCNLIFPENTFFSLPPEIPQGPTW